MWEVIQEIPTSILIAIVVVLAVGIAMLVWYTAFERPIEDAKRDAIKHSHAYIEASRSRLLKYAKEYRTAGTQILQYEAAQKAGEVDYSKIIADLRNQQNACMEQMKEEAQRIPQNEVPESVRKLLDQEKENDDEKIYTLRDDIPALYVYPCWV